MRKWMRLFESKYHEEWREAIEDKNWKDALLYSETPEQVATVIAACGAREVSLPGETAVYVLTDAVIS